MVLGETLSGGGHADHLFGKLYSDLVRSYYFGRLDLGSSGELFYSCYFPRDAGVAPYGWLVRTPVNGAIPRARAITGILESRPARGAGGLAYCGVIEMSLGQVAEPSALAWNARPLLRTGRFRSPASAILM
jgi:hypothetical protein